MRQRYGALGSQPFGRLSFKLGSVWVENEQFELGDITRFHCLFHEIVSGIGFNSREQSYAVPCMKTQKSMSDKKKSVFFYRTFQNRTKNTVQLEISNAAVISCLCFK